ncbi:MAG: hypothetical protein OXC68_00910 [Aestuariivita sp.]|nr:hypothetical protein [Aestuariivita sp.]
MSAPFDKQNFKKNAHAASAANQLLAYLHKEQAHLANPCFDEICQSLTELHNLNQLNLITHINSDELPSGANRDFWLIQNLFCKIAPDLEVDIDSLISAVDRLVANAGQDLCANQPNVAFREWLKKRPEETSTVLERLKHGNDQLLPFLTFVLEAGATIDMEIYHSAAQAFLTDTRPLARLSALTALGQIDATSNKALHISGLQDLACFIEQAKSKDEIAAAIRALLDNSARGQFLKDADVIRLIELATQNASPALHHNLAMMLGQHHMAFSTPIKLGMISALNASDPSIKDIVDQIDYAFSQCLDPENRTAIATCLQQLLDHPKTPLQISDLENFVHNLAENHTDTLGWLVVHWLRNGNHATRSALPALFHRSIKKDHTLHINLDPFNFSDAELIFISRKALGYFLIETTTVTSLLISFLRAVSKKDAAQEIAELLVEPLMINFPGQARDVVEQAAQTKDKGQQHLQAALKAHETYLDDLRSIPEIKELWPSGIQQQVQNKRQKKLISQLYKKAESSSVLLSLASKQTLLYKVGSITYIRNSNGELERNEHRLSSYSTSIEFPRLDHIAPLQYHSRIIEFRTETFDS